MKDTPLQFAWRAPHFVHHERSSEWYMILWSVVIALALVLIALGNITGALLAFVAGITLHVMAIRNPDIIEIAIDDRGVHINNALTPFPELSAFSFFEDPQGFDHLIMETKRFFPGHIKLIVSPKIPQQELVAFLRTHLPEKEYKEGLADFLARVLKI